MAQGTSGKRGLPSPKPPSQKRVKFTLNEKCINFFSDKAEDEGDVLFIVGSEKEKIKAFKLLLRISSPVFDRQFSSIWDTAAKIEIPDIPPKIFRIFLKLMLENEINSECLDELALSLDEIFQLLYTSKKYDVAHISDGVISYLYCRLTNENVIYIYDEIDILANDPKVSKTFFNYIEKNLSEIIKTEENYREMTRDTLKRILQSNYVNINELKLFGAVCDWASAQCQLEEKEVTGENLREILGDLLYLLRFPLMSREEFVEFVVPRKILNSDEALSVLVYIDTPAEKRTLEQEKALLFKTCNHRTLIVSIKFLPNSKLFVRKTSC